MGRSDGFDIEIVGVAANSAYDDVKKDEQSPLVLMPYRQDPDLAGANIYARTSGSEQDLLAALPRIVRNIDPGLPVADPRTMTAQVLENVAIDRFVTMMSAAFAVPRHAAGGARSLRRARIHGDAADERVRPPDGARCRGERRAASRASSGRVDDGRGRSDRSGDRALALGRAAESLLFQMSARDPMVFAGATIVLIAVALCAGLIPAQRAARVDPMTALRYE